MRFCFRIIYTFITCFFALTGYVYARPNANDKMDAVLLIDSSASMLVTDPLKLRNEGARLFLQLLRPIDRLAIIQFSDKAEILRPLSPYNREQTEILANAINNIDNTGIYTNITSAIEKGVNILKESGRSDSEKSIIVLSDGEMSPNPKDGTPELLTQQLFDKVLPSADINEIKVYTLSFSNEADRELLSKIAKVTKSEYWYSPSADKIHQAFADLFLVAKNPQMLPIENEAFTIDDDINEVTIYINRDDSREVSIITPNGNMLTRHTENSNVKWLHGVKFEVVTIFRPQRGSWYIEGLKDTGGFVAIITNLKLNVEWPREASAGIPILIQARLYDSAKPIVLDDITKSITYKFNVTPIDRVSEPIISEELVDDGTSGDKVANDGIFSKRLNIKEIGDYRISITAVSPTFQRYQQQVLHIVPRLVTLDVVPQAESELAKYQKKKNAPVLYQKYFKASFSKAIEDVTNIKVKLRITDENGELLSFPIKKINNFYEIQTDILPKDGTYTLYAELTARDKKTRKPVTAESFSIQFTKNENASNTEEKEEIELIQTVSNLNTLKKGEQKEFEFFIIAIVIVTLGILSATTFTYYFLKKAILLKIKNTSSIKIDQINLLPLDNVSEIYATLDTLSNNAEIDLNDPKFSDTHYAGSGVHFRINTEQETEKQESDEKKEGEAEK